MKQFLQILSIAIIALLFTACSSTQPTGSTLIKDTSKLKPSPYNDTAHYYLKKNIDFSMYSHVHVPKIEILDEKQQDKASAELKSKISNYFTNTLNEKLNKEIMNNKGTKTLVFDVAVTTLDVGFEAMKAYNFIPIGLAIKAISRGTGIEERQLSLAIALRVTDKNSGEIIAMVVDSKIKEKIKDIQSLTFTDVKPLLDEWITLYAKRLNELNQGKYKNL